jgi:hypothetical protein
MIKYDMYQKHLILNLLKDTFNVLKVCLERLNIQMRK